MKQFFKTFFNQEMPLEKTKIIDLRAGKAKFLGYEIYFPKKKRLSVCTSQGIRTIQKTNQRLRFDIPLEIILNRMIEKGYIMRNEKGIRPISKQNYSSLEDEIIISHFRVIWIGLSNYYSGCTNLSKLQYIYYLLKFSCAMTLAHRHRMSLRSVFAKYTKELKIRKNQGTNSTNHSKIISFSERKNWSIKDRKWQTNMLFVDPLHIFANNIKSHYSD